MKSIIFEMAKYTEVFAWGNDAFGQLGLAQKDQSHCYSSPRFCSFNVQIKRISCGETHSAFIEMTGLVYTMGNNDKGQLGLGRTGVDRVGSPCLVEALRNGKAIDISCGASHTGVIMSDGHVYTWGSGDTGALGTGGTDSYWQPVLVPLPKDFGPESIAFGNHHSAVLGSTPGSMGLLFTCGAGDAGQLGTGKRYKETSFCLIPHPEPVKQVSLGEFHTAFVTVLGRVFTMGGNNFGQLGTGTHKGSSWPTPVRALEGISVLKVACGSHTAALSSSGDLYLWGSSVFGEFLTPQKQTNLSKEMVDISIGANFGTALDSSGQLWVWGSNSSGELALGDFDPRSHASPLLSLRGKRIRTAVCGASFVLALGNDVRQPRHQSANLNTTRPSRKRVEIDEITVTEKDPFSSTKSTARMRPGKEWETEPSSRREMRIKPVSDDSETGKNGGFRHDGAALRLKLEAQISGLSQELHELEAKLSEVTAALSEERTRRILVETDLQQSSFLHTQDLQEVSLHMNSRDSELQRLAQKCERLENDLKNSDFSHEKELADLEERMSREKNDEITSLKETLQRTQGRLEKELMESRKAAEDFRAQATEARAQSDWTKRDLSLLQTALEKAEDHNRELLSALDRRSVSRARDFRERSMTALASPSPFKGSYRSSLIGDNKSNAGQEGGETEGRMEQSRILTPLQEHDLNHQLPPLPTFRDPSSSPILEAADLLKSKLSAYRDLRRSDFSSQSEAVL